MSILVVCPSCRKSFNVSEKFAGKSGPCPNCKKTIVVPEKGQEVVILPPEEFAEGGRSTSGKLVTKPVAYKSARLNAVGVTVVLGITATVLLVTWLAGGVIAESRVVRGIGLTLISPLLAVAAYSVLRNDELEPYRDRSLYLRATICGVVYAILWGVYVYVARAMLIPAPERDLWEWLFVVPPFIASGGLVALACLDLDYGNGCLHYAFYVLVTVLLGWIAGIPWA